jgi:small ligand-binding sensory domain FIST
MSVLADPLDGAAQAARAAGEELGGARPDLALVFAGGAHMAAPEATLEGVHEVLAPTALIGCGAGGVLAAGREVESGTAVAVWAGSFEPAAEIEPFHATGGFERLDGIPSLAGASGVILLCDPYSFPTADALVAVGRQAPAVPVLGALASARRQSDAAALFLDDQLPDRGAVGVVMRGIEMLPCVSQGAAPLGREVTITAAEGNIIHELAGRPALETVQEIIAGLDPRERALIGDSVLIGIVIDSGKPDYEPGDFLVRGVLGADRASGQIAVGTKVREGQVVRLHARDAQSADEDLRRALELRVAAMAGTVPAGALVFTCNGRGRAMFGSRDHDAQAIARELDGAPAAGFFGAGEIGPVGTRSWLHGYTATVAVFPSS